MATTKRGKGPAKSRTTRASVSLPKELYETLGRIAEGKKVSTAWVIREAVERYVSDQWPLLGR
jgi:metal-responsive CopG/Arc/MetJ family transcriptional regulator